MLLRVRSVGSKQLARSFQHSPFNYVRNFDFIVLDFQTRNTEQILKCQQNAKPVQTFFLRGYSVG